MKYIIDTDKLPCNNGQNCTSCPFWSIDDSCEIREQVKRLPKYEERPHGEWIPCSERLPEEHGYYLVTTDGSRNAVIDIAEYGKFFRKPEYECVWEWNKASKILAWMPLPEPHKEEGEAE